MKWFKKFKNKHREAIQEVKDTSKEISTVLASNMPQYIHENRNKLFDEVRKYYKGEINKETIISILKAGFIFLNCATPQQEEEILKTFLDVHLDIKKDSDFTNEEFDIYKEIISYIHNNRQIEVKILLKKAAQKLNNKELNISKETIDFITSITDEKLEILKKIFRYVVAVGIFNYKNIIQDFQQMNFCQTHSDNIKFLNRIFVNQDGVGGKGYNNKLETIEIAGILSWKNAILNEESFKKALIIEELHELKKFLEKDFKYTILSTNKIKFYITKQPVSPGTIEFNMKWFAILTEVGTEMYSLLEDEIENYPIEYLEAIINDERYKNFGLIYEIQS